MAQGTVMARVRANNNMRPRAPAAAAPAACRPSPRSLRRAAPRPTFVPRASEVSAARQPPAQPPAPPPPPPPPLTAAAAPLPQDDGTPSASGTEDDGALEAMDESLLERARAVAAAGVVGADFAEAFVPELEAEFTALRANANTAEDRAAAVEEQLRSAKDQLTRMAADFDNFRKRTAVERAALAASVKGDTVAALLPLVDNFELAKRSLKLESAGEERVDAAYQGLYKQMVEAFRALGLEAVPGAGEPFDPEVHEAIMREPSEDVPDGTVLEEFRKGFRLGERLLRPAMVKVSFSEAPAPAAAAAGGGGEGEAE
jgi:molecular chaperone GrpE